MPSRWYRSLYWRIAIGFVLCLAAMLVVQAVLFVWVVSRSGPRLPGEPDRFAESVAVDIGQALESEPQLDIAQYINEQYARDAHPFFVMLADGRVVANGGGPFPEPLLRMARARLQRRDARSDRFERRGRPGRGGPGVPPARAVPLVAHGQIAGVVVVLPRAPFGFLLERYAPTLALVAAGVLIAGALLASVVIFGPARRRLRAVEEAARRLGAGDLTARAPARGGDEVAAVAAAFNTMADDLTARADALAAADRARRQLLADVSHELTTPVTAMRGYLETLTMPELDLDEATRARHLAIVGDETGRLERIIGDLLDLARLEGGGGSFVVDTVQTRQLFARVVARHEPGCREAGVTIATVIEPGAETVRGDQSRLEQALQNLAANAIRYAPAGTAIELRARPAGRDAGAAASDADRPGVTITVSDEGPGIAPEHLPHVFDRFYKGETSRAVGQAADADSGSGLGLSIVKAIVERHGGSIRVDSRPGRTVFELTIYEAPAAAGP